MTRIARVRWLIALLPLIVAVSGCTALVQRWMDWRGGTTSLPPEQQRELQTRFAQGATALAGNDVDGAIAAWRGYVRAAPATLPQARRVRGYLTLLERESARRFARQAVAGERAAPAVQSGGPLHVALFPFRVEGPGAGANPALSRALLAMITTDLAQVPGLTVLERERIDALLREQRLAASGLVDAAAAAAPGRLLGAGTVVAGTVYNEPGPQGPGSGRYRINSAARSVGDARLVGVQQAEGLQADFFRLEKEVVLGLLQALGVTDIPPAVHRVHTRSWEAYARFAAGLSLLAEDRFDDARAAFREALKFDPGFALAQEAFDAVPARMASVEEIRQEVGTMQGGAL